MNKQFLIIAMVSLVVGLMIGSYFNRNTSSDPTVSAPSDQAAAEPLFYRNPMDPNITSPVPAKDHMGMDYVPVYADADTNLPAGTVSIDPVTMQSMGVRTTAATHADISRRIHTLGRVSYDETAIIRLHPKTEGWIEELRIQTTGETIKTDEILLSLYSPQLVATQQEYLLALANREQLTASASNQTRISAKGLVDTARQRLELLDVPEHQIREITESGKAKKHLHIHSPGGGTVIKVGARVGQFVTPKTEIYFIADLTRLWVFVDIYEDDLPWISVGDDAVMTLRGLPGSIFTGNLTYIYPYAERQTRTIKARLEFDNTQGLLKPDMLADIEIKASPARHVLVVPSEAVIHSGTRNLVFVNAAPGKFEPREVMTGVSGDGLTRILSGLRLNEQVVVSGQFLIDSESKLREAAAKMSDRNLVETRRPAKPAATGMMEHNHD